MFAKALLAFLALPGVMAFAIPVYWLVATDRRMPRCCSLPLASDFHRAEVRRQALRALPAAAVDHGMFRLLVPVTT